MASAAAAVGARGARALAPGPQPGSRHRSSSGGSKCTSRQALQVTACHRCVARQLVAVSPAALHGAGRGAGSAAALRSTRLDAQHDVQGGTEDSSQQEQQAQQGQAGAQPPAAPEQEDSPGVQAALAMLRFYKGAISPLLPPACRFLPTCSVYAMDAFKTYGVNKGFVLTTWRLLRCAPWGNKGYDPVCWPPPGLEFMFSSSPGSGDGSDGKSGPGSGGAAP